jgi:phage baseplate assembly protein V
MSDRLFARMLAPLRRAVHNMVLRGAVKLVNSASKMQTLQITMRNGEGKENIEHAETYGFTANPKPGAESIAIFFDGDRSHGIVIVTPDRRYRLTGLLSGEVAIHDDQGQKIHLKRDRVLVQTPFKFEVIADKIDLHATSEFRWDVNGHGQVWLPTKIDTWQIGEVAGTPHNIAPPRIP